MPPGISRIRLFLRISFPSSLAAREIAVILGYGTTDSEEDIPLKKPLCGFRAHPVLKIPECHKLFLLTVFPNFYVPFTKRATIPPPLYLNPFYLLSIIRNVWSLYRQNV